MGKKLHVFLSYSICIPLAGSCPTASFSAYIPATDTANIWWHLSVSTLAGAGCHQPSRCPVLWLAARSYTVGNIKDIPLKDLNCIESNKAVTTQCLLHFKLLKISNSGQHCVPTHSRKKVQSVNIGVTEVTQYTKSFPLARKSKTQQ